MNLKVYRCSFKSEESCCFVAAPSRGQAKTLFFNEHPNAGKWNDIRCTVMAYIPNNIPITPRCITATDPLLKQLGL